MPSEALSVRFLDIHSASSGIDGGTCNFIYFFGFGYNTITCINLSIQWNFSYPNVSYPNTSVIQTPQLTNAIAFQTRPLLIFVPWVDPLFCLLFLIVRFEPYCPLVNI